MKVILNVNCTSCYKQGVQYCNTPEGFAGIQETHPEDVFIIDGKESLESYYTFKDFCEVMGFNSSHYFTCLQWIKDRDEIIEASLVNLYEL